MSARPGLTVVIPCHRRADLLAEALSSIEMHAPRNTEVIVVADGSADAAVVAADFGVTVIHWAEPRGFCAAANAGIRAAQTEFVQLLNDDAAVTAGWAEPALAAFADPRLVAVAPLVMQWDGELIDSAGDAYDRGGFATPRGRGRRLTDDWLHPGPIESASGCAAFYRRSAVLAVGGFAESFGAYFEDVDLSCRLRRAGGRIEYVPASRVRHRGSSSYGPPTGRLLERQSCNEERLFWRNRAGTPGELLRHGAVLVGKTLRRIREGTLAPWLRGRWQAWRQFGSDRRQSVDSRRFAEAFRGTLLRSVANRG